MIPTLIADDSSAELDVLLYLIKKYELPLESAVAHDGEEALTYLQEHNVDLLITDIRMPFLDGLNLSKKALELNPRLKIIISSAYQDFAYAKTAIALGVKEYLLKPIDAQEFVDLIQRMTQEWTQEKRALLLLTIEQEQMPLLNNLRPELCRLAKNYFDAHVDCLMLSDCALLLIGQKSNTVWEEAILKQYMNRFAVMLYSMYHLPLRISCGCLPVSGELTEALHTLKNIEFPINTIISDELADDILPDQISQIPDNSNGKVRFLCEYISSHYKEDLSLESLADIAYLHPDYLSRIFKRETGINLNRYIKTLRLKEACRLLDTTHKKIAEIGADVGFINSSYFIRVFTENFGMSPERYRQNHGADKKENQTFENN